MIEHNIAEYLPWGVAFSCFGTMFAVVSTYNKNSNNLKEKYISKESCALKKENIELKIENLEKKIDGHVENIQQNIDTVRKIVLRKNADT